MYLSYANLHLLIFSIEKYISVDHEWCRKILAKLNAILSLQQSVFDFYIIEDSSLNGNISAVMNTP